MVCFGGFLISVGFVGFSRLCLFNGFVAGLCCCVVLRVSCDFACCGFFVGVGG